MNTPFTDQFDKQYLLENMMGPNAMRIAEEMTAGLSLAPGMRILDLGCGMGITSILMAKKYGATVFAADLWISPTDNAERFTRLGLDSRIFPFHVDATKEIPFAHEYFDMILSVDAYQYFGTNEEMLPKLLPFVKKGGILAVAVPGFNQDFPNGEMPEVIKRFWTPEWYFFSRRWWHDLWRKEPGLNLIESREMDCCRQAWDEWLQSPSQHAGGDIPMMEAGAGEYFSIIQLIGKKL